MRTRRILLSILSVLTLVALGLATLQPAQAAGKPGGGGGGGGGGSTTGNIGVKIQGYDALSRSWTPGNTAGYPEKGKIPFRLILTGSGNLSTLQILADHFRAPAPGFEDLLNFQVCDGGVVTGTPPGGTSCDPVPVGGPGPNGGVYVTADQASPPPFTMSQIGYTFHNITVSPNPLVLTWDGLLAIGSHLYPGSALHMAIGTATGASSSDTISFGSKDVPIPVNGILATETDKTVNGQDPYTSAVLHEIVTVSIVGKAVGPAKGTQTLTIRDELPSCLRYIPNSAVPAATPPTPTAPGGVLTWTFAGVKNGTTKTVTFRAEVVELGDCTNVAFTHSDQVPDDSRDDVDINVRGIPDVSPVKDCTDTVDPGGTAQCTITYTNNGSETSAPGTVRDVLDPGLVFVPGTPAPKAGYPVTNPDGSTTVVWDIPALAPQASGVISYGETVPETGTVGTHQYADTATTIVPGDDDDEDTEIVTVNYTPDLNVNKDCPTSASAGGQATYTISFGNGGTAPSAAGSIVDTLPAGMAFVSSTRTGATVTGQAQTGQTVTWALPNGVPAKTAGTSFTVTVSVSGSGPFTNKVDIFPKTGDADPTNNHDECSTGLDYTDVGIDKSCPSTASPNDVVTHTLTFGNSGNQPASNVVVTDTLGTGLTKTSAAPTYVLNGGAPAPAFQQTGQVLKWTFASLPAGASGTISYQVAIADWWDSAGIQLLVDSVGIATASTNETGSANNSDDCTTSVDFQPHLTLDKSGCLAVVVPGGYQTYTLTYRNDGHAPAGNVVITDQPPANQPIASVTGPGSNVDQDTNTATWTIGTLGQGPAQAVTLTVQVNAEEGAIVTNSASISGSPSVSASDAFQTAVSGEGRHAKADGYSLGVTLGTTKLLDPALTASTAEAPPSPSDDVTGYSGGVPGVLTAGLITTTAHAETGVGSAMARHTTEVLNLTVLNPVPLMPPLVQAGAIRTVATSVAGPLGAQSSSLGTASVALSVGGTPYDLANVPPNTIVDLSPVARVTLNAVTKSASLDGNGHFVTRVDIDAVKVELLLSSVVVVVGHSHAEAAYPSGMACGVSPSTVSGRAYTAHVKGLSMVETWLNDAEITPLGSMPGEDANAATAVVAGVLAAGAVTNHAEGTIGTAPHAYAHSKVVGLNLLNGMVTADVLDMESTSNAGAGPASTVLSAIFTNLRVNGTLYTNPLPNQVINIPMGGDIVHLVLNEQFQVSQGTTDTEGTVNAVHLQVFNAVGALKTDVVVASAHSDAHKGG